jgi:hypothetical protein
MEKILTAEEAKKIASNVNAIEFLMGEICSRIRNFAQKGLKKMILSSSELSIDLNEINPSFLTQELKKLGYDTELRYYNEEEKKEIKSLKILWI